MCANVGRDGTPSVTSWSASASGYQCENISHQWENISQRLSVGEAELDGWRMEAGVVGAVRMGGYPD